jgi:uncharacterized protein YndB with AHSA1/START domain
MGKTIKQTVNFKASPHEVFELIMDEEKHAGFTDSDCSISREVGGKFECYGGYIKGENLEVVQDKKIVQTWIGKDFPKDKVSKVTFKFIDDGVGCKLDFVHEDVPDELAKHIEKGWKDHYWEKMKKYLGE